MLEKTQLLHLGKTLLTAKRDDKVAITFNNKSYDYNTLETTVRDQFNELIGTNAKYRQNKNLAFELMEELIDDILPKKVMEQYSMFAEIKTFNQGDKPIFVQRITEASKRRAKQFVTKVGLAGVYEVFKLDGREYEVPTSAYGGAAQISLEEYLDGRITMADVFDLVLEGLDEIVYQEIAKALVGAITDLQAANKVKTNTFDETEFDRLLSIADSYGKSTIYCTFEFAATMIPTSGWISDEMRNEKWNNGYLGNYKGHRVVVLSQSYTDETNTKKVIDPQYAWIIPDGANGKPVKIAFEGQTQVRDVDNADWSKEIQTYKKMGVAAIITNNICVYQNEALAI